MNKALAHEVARELNLPPEKVYEICKSFHDGLRQLMSKPEECGKGILIQGFLCFNFKMKKLEHSAAQPGFPEIYEIVLNNLRNGTTVKKKQTNKEDDCS